MAARVTVVWPQWRAGTAEAKLGEITTPPIISLVFGANELVNLTLFLKRVKGIGDLVNLSLWRWC